MKIMRSIITLAALCLAIAMVRCESMKKQEAMAHLVSREVSSPDSEIAVSGLSPKLIVPDMPVLRRQVGPTTTPSPGGTTPPGTVRNILKGIGVGLMQLASGGGLFGG